MIGDVETGPPFPEAINGQVGDGSTQGRVDENGVDNGEHQLADQAFVSVPSSVVGVKPAVLEARMSKRRAQSAFVKACDELIAFERLEAPKELTDWLDESRSALEAASLKKMFSLKVTLIISIVAMAVATVATWFATKAIVPTVYMGLGLFLGPFGVMWKQAESAAVGGILAKALAWYLAPSIDGLDQVARYFLSVCLAAFLEYPFLTFANAIALKQKTAISLRAIQDTVDIVLTFILVIVSGIGKLDVFSITQTVLALVRVAVVLWGPRLLLPAPKNVSKAQEEELPGEHDLEDIASAISEGPTLPPKRRRRVLTLIVKNYPIIKGEFLSGETDAWVNDRRQELAVFPKLTFLDRLSFLRSKGALVCGATTVLGIVLGVIGYTVTNEPYLLGIASVLGMGLAWYLGPSLRGTRFWFRWTLSVLLSAALEYPFLTEANTRAAEDQLTFELRAIQDLTGMVASTILIMALSHVRLNRIDALQLFIGFLRVLVVTRFFWSV